jgi:murein DD-endopeptidase MepM/ murein hydrolase activator NlpD
VAPFKFSSPRADTTLVTHITRVALILATAAAAVAIIVMWRPPVAEANHRTEYLTGPDHEFGEMVDYPLVFPLEGSWDFADWFWAPRGSGIHHAIDIMAPRWTPVRAVADGTIHSVNYSRDPDNVDPDRCCTIILRHDDDWRSWYIHLNNDSAGLPPGECDGQGWGIADGILPGVQVQAGQLLGWVGSSGNAPCNGPHLHYELQDPHGVIVNPYESLKNPIEAPPQQPIPGDPCPNGADCDGFALVDSGARWMVSDGLSGFAAPFYFGNPGDHPILGDWNGDGIKTPGMYRRSTGLVYLRNSNTAGVADITFFFGNPGDIPIVGDFNGDGKDTVSIYRPSEGRIFIINQLGQNGGGLGAAQYDYYFGNPGDKPFTGDFNGNGIDTVGLHRETTGFVYFRNSHTQGNADHQFFFGDPGDKILAGDWNGDGKATVALYRPSTRTAYFRLTNTQGNADVTWWVGTWAGAVG